MAENGFPGGMILVYGVAIGGAVARGNASLEELVALRSQAKAIVDAQGDLNSALTAIEKEIAARGGPAGAKSVPLQIASGPSERFVVQIIGLPVPPEAKLKIEAVINETVMATLARHDSRGDLVATPLSQIKSYGGGLGGTTAGLWIHPNEL